jgi:pantetheine-phosphate adenylyltransferase
MNRRRAMFAGSFDPPTLGHLDIIKRSASLFDKLFVVIAVNPDKHYMFTSSERREMLSEMTSDIENVEICTWDGYSVEFASQHNVGVMVRGIRTGDDFDYEYSMANTNRNLLPEIETVLIPADPRYFDISSSKIKQKLKEGEDISSLVPSFVLKRLT